MDIPMLQRTILDISQMLANNGNCKPPVAWVLSDIDYETVLEEINGDAYEDNGQRVIGTLLILGVPVIRSSDVH